MRVAVIGPDSPTNLEVHVPQVILPLILDWLDYAHCTYVTRLAPRTVPTEKISATELAKAIQTSLPVLTNCEALGNPPINLLYRQNQRRIPRVRGFVDFLVELFAELVVSGGVRPDRLEAPPRWARGLLVRASTMFKNKPRD